MMSLSHMLVFCTVVSNTSRPVILIPDSFCPSFHHCIAAVPWSGGLFSYVQRARCVPAQKWPTGSHTVALRQSQPNYVSANCHVIVTVCPLYRQIVRGLESWHASMRRMSHAVEALPSCGIMGYGTILVRLFQRAQRSGQRGPVSRPLRPMYVHVPHKKRGEPYAKSTPHPAISQRRGYD